MAGPRRHGHGPAPVEKAKDFKGSILKLLKYIGRYKIALAFVIIFAVASTVFNILGPKIMGNATTELFNGIISKFSGGAGIDFAAIANILLWLIALYVASALFAFIQGLIMVNISQKIGYRMRNEIIRKINRLPMNYFDKKQTGEVLSIVTNDVDTLTTGLNQSATQLITSAATIIGVLYMMFSINWMMTLIALLILPLSVGFVSVIGSKSQKYFKSQQDYLGHVNGQVEETFSGIRVVQAFNGEKKNIEEFDKANNILYTSAWKSQFLSGLMMPIMQFIGNIGYAAIAVLGGFLAINGTITVGNIQSFVQYVRQFTQPIQQLAQVSNMIQSMAAASERIFDFLGETEEDQTAENPAEITDKITGKKRRVTPDDIDGSVSFDNVSFGYSSDKIIIKNFNAHIKPGQKVAIVGPTGAGKTTMVKLLMRFYDVNTGSISVGGYNIKDFDRSELRELFGMVLQDLSLIHI